MDSHTLLQALIYLGSAALIVPIAVRLGLGSVLGYCGLHYRPLGATAGNGRRIYSAFCGNRRRADVVCYWA